MYNLGDKIVYPMHGAGIIESIEEKEILGKKKQYYVMIMPICEMKLMVPVGNEETIGVRSIIEGNEVDDIFSILKEDAELTDLNWNKRFRENMDKMKTGDIYEIACIVRDLAYRDSEKGLSTGEKKMLNDAKKILISEIILAKNCTAEHISQLMEDMLSQN